MPDELITAGQLAERLKRSPHTLAVHRITGQGVPFVRLGRSIRYPTSDVEAYLAGLPLRRSTSDNPTAEAASNHLTRLHAMTD